MVFIVSWSLLNLTLKQIWSILTTNTQSCQNRLHPILFLSFENYKISIIYFNVFKTFGFEYSNTYLIRKYVASLFEFDLPPPTLRSITFFEKSDPPQRNVIYGRPLIHFKNQSFFSCSVITKTQLFKVTNSDECSEPYSLNHGSNPPNSLLRLVLISTSKTHKAILLAFINRTLLASKLEFIKRAINPSIIS